MKKRFWFGRLLGDWKDSRVAFCVIGVALALVGGVFWSRDVVAADKFYWVECDKGGAYGDEYIVGYGTQEQFDNYNVGTFGGNWKDTMVLRIKAPGGYKACMDTYGSKDNEPKKIGAGTIDDAQRLLVEASRLKLGHVENEKPIWGDNSADENKLNEKYYGLYKQDPQEMDDYNDLTSLFILECDAKKLVGNPPSATTDDGFRKTSNANSGWEDTLYYEVWGVNSSGKSEKSWYSFQEREGCKEIAKRLSSNELKGDLDEKTEEGESIVEGTEASEDDIKAEASGMVNSDDKYFMGRENYTNCTKSAGVFSWVVCPMVDWLMESVQSIFGAIESFLMIDSKILDIKEEGKGVYAGWQTFRDIANVIIVIILVLIIISQVTGFGIDNYGIKKMLPRLIVIAILVNLSFVLCQVAVDVTNVLGSNLYKFLQSLAAQLGYASSLSGASNTANVVMVSLMVSILGFVIVMIINPAVLLMLGISLVGALISVMFMFLLLGVRQAAAAMFVVIAPVALVANVLPNTTNLFKKWWNIFKVILLLYPICSLVMGGSYYGAMLMMSIKPTDGQQLIGFIFGIVSLVLLFAPVFFIPKLTKGAFEGLGKLGGAIAGLGGKLSGTTTGAIKGSEVYGRAQTALKGRSGISSTTRAIRRQDALETKEARKAKARKARLWSSHPELAQAREAATDAAEKDAITKAQIALYDRDNSGDSLDDAKRYFNDAMRSGDSSRIEAAATILRRKGPAGVDAMAEYVDSLSGADRGAAINDLAGVVGRINGMQGDIDNRAADLGESLKRRSDLMGNASVLREMDAPQLASQGTSFYRRMSGKVTADTPEARLINDTINSTSPVVRDKLTKEGRLVNIGNMMIGGVAPAAQGSTDSGDGVAQPGQVLNLQGGSIALLTPEQQAQQVAEQMRRVEEGARNQGIILD